ncbi:DUF4055 domain-containing protein [Phaeobacter gallaeciensis]|uniref:DUF4055 domain-containing protein n=1 Tax=Phaeobacter gallaeciensis TaxID=60890 RepID=UPI00237F3806|nr:DUF4055 domain-containing protein [Phaeobacter gallaeciensis]MDE4303658.1 DUF4055 domain-containing protein [Phaeobacter gallaeciensis]MDE4307861.1 DUF4055 domain-containing protein [Phaeobacter gallaeciensis]MDE4312319.1 DUF4055 domain-containing protein [Phaeobacter gallaeciensis]MDE4316790.1 DUF4055 domain-containing protein [Phaeobacter gallaeciensis]MDE4321253.1 DUF4055 domain-containing protein [Phaeobacter gallaeciensis]
MTTFYTNPRAGIAAQIAVRAHAHTHPDYEYWAPVWAKIRDAELGEVQVKAKAQEYLPKLAGHDRSQYASFLDRAVFYNMTAKTLNALYGSMFVRPPKVTGYTPKGRFSRDGHSLNLTAKLAAKEVLAVGRFGMLVDSAANGRGGPFVATYTSESILDWEVSNVDGENRLIRVVLREAAFDRSEDAGANEIATRFRVLTLQPSLSGWRYVVHIFDDHTGSGIPDLNALPDETIVPTVRGRALDHIPFTFVGPFSNVADVAKPPLLDIVTLNYSHYKSYAHLEQGRFYTANPVYTVSSGTADDESGEYYVGPDMVWELGKDGKAEILEFGGQGLRSLESALTTKEAQIAAIGGRMLPGANTGPGESANALRLREANEQSLLLNVADCLDEAFTIVLTWLADWSNKPTDGIEFEVAREWATKQTGARELRAMHQMYADGVIPVEVFFEFLRKADVVPDWMELEEFRDLLNREDQFPNVPEVLARMRGYPDAATWANAQKAALQ